jgi:hypothetical protein
MVRLHLFAEICSNHVFLPVILVVGAIGIWHRVESFGRGNADEYWRQLETEISRLARSVDFHTNDKNGKYADVH